MTAAHDRPNGRPIHPECPASRHSEALCECTALWAGWDGTETSLGERIAALDAKESRRRHWLDIPPEETDLHGFWRESERLKAALANLEKAA